MNVVADALSRWATFSLLQICKDWKIQLATEYSKDQFACDVLDVLNQNEEYKVHEDLIYYKNRIFLVPGSTLKRKILGAAHDAPVAGHPGFMKTYCKVRERFTWKGLKDDVLMYVKECSTCQKNKFEH